MTWLFDQAPNAACVTSKSVMSGHPVLVAVHCRDDNSWGFTDGEPVDPKAARVVAMAEVVDLHPDLTEIVSLPPGWRATRHTAGEPWLGFRDTNECGICHSQSELPLSPPATNFTHEVQSTV